MPSSFRLYLIRHGQPRATFADAIDPGLSDIGKLQAQGVAEKLAALGPLPVVTSPLQRARETALPFEALWNANARVEPRIAEIPSPTENLVERAAWIAQIMHGRWGDLPSRYQDWREQVRQCLLTCQTTTVITTHFIAINVAVGFATGDNRIVCFEPDHCSSTVLEIESNSLKVISLGRQRATQVR